MTHFGRCSMRRNLCSIIEKRMEVRRTLRIATSAFVACLVCTGSAFSEDKITYQDQILPMIEANCSKCHNSDKKKADLELTSYQGALKGSGSGPVVVSGNLDGSKLWKALTHAEEPFMPPNRPKLEEKELEKFKKWIVGGLLENTGSKAVPAVSSGVDLALKPEAIGKPDGPAPMPKELPRAIMVHTAHTNAIVGVAVSPRAPLAAIGGQKQILLYGSPLSANVQVTNETTTNNSPLSPDAKCNEGRCSLLGVLPFGEGQPVDLKFSRNGKLLLASGGRGAKSGRVVVWDVLSGERLMTLGDEYDSILAADIRPDQSQVAFGGPTRLVKILSTKTGEVQHKIKKHTEWVTGVAFSPNGEMLASADRNGGISIWDPDNAQELFTLAGHKTAITALSWRTDSKLLASSSEDGAVKIWELKEGKQVKNWAAHAGGALCVNYASDGLLVTCGRDNAVILWDSNGNKIRSMTGPFEIPLRATFTCDSKQIVTSDFAGRVSLWNVSDGKLACDLDANPLPPPGQIAEAKQPVRSKPSIKRR